MVLPQQRLTKIHPLWKRLHISGKIEVRNKMMTEVKLKDKMAPSSLEFFNINKYLADVKVLLNFNAVERVLNTGEFQAQPYYC